MEIKTLFMGTLLAVTTLVPFATQENPEVPSNHTPLKVFCYYSITWKNFPLTGSYLSKVDNLCSYLILGYIKVDPRWGPIIANNDSHPSAKDFNNTKILLTTYLPVTRTSDETAVSADKRKSLIQTIIKLVRSYHYHGVQLDYGAYTTGSRVTNVVAVRDEVVQDFRTAFDEEAAQTGKSKLFLSIVSPSIGGYSSTKLNIGAVAENSDWVFFQNGNHYEPVKHLEALSQKANHSLQPDRRLFVDTDEDIVNHFLSLGIKSEKLVFGLYTFGYESSPAKSFRSDRIASHYFNKICDQLNSGWTMVYLNDTAMGSYAIREDTWIFIQDTTTIRTKTRFAINKNLGGISIQINGDDYTGKCYDKEFPLTEAAKETVLSS